MNLRWLQFLVAITLIAFSCKKDEPVPASGVVASFQFAQDPTDFRKVQFTNFSTNAASVSWNFGDGSAASADLNPLHTYTAAGTYSVVLTATGADKVTSVKTTSITLADPNLELKKLTGETTKSWKLLRSSTGKFPLQVGPTDHSQIWWALGLNQELGVRPCLLNDEWVFNINKSYEYKTNGDIWAEEGVWSNPPSATCVASTSGNLVNKDGASLTAWGDGVHPFEYDPTAKTLKVTGGFVGLTKAGTSEEVIVPQSSVTYKVIGLVDGPVDTLTLETTLTTANGYWRMTLVHYDTPSQEPPIPGAKPVVGYTYSVAGKTVTYTNTTTGTGTITYAWDFGDGAASTTASPVHTYATDGAYTVKLTATNGNGSNISSQQVIISSTTLTEALLNGGGTKIWKLKAAAGAFGVGPSAGSDAWYPNGVNISGDRPCLFNDEFVFKTGGIYQYDAKTDVWAENYWGVGTPDACNAESAITGNAAIWKSKSHTYVFTPAAGANKATIAVTGLGAFIVLPKAYNGGEYTTPPTVSSTVTYTVLSYVNDGTTQTMQITVDISGTGGGFWSFTLESH